MVTEITRRHEHEEFHNDDIPDSDSDEFERVEHQEGDRNYSHAKSENFIDYVAVPKGRKLSEGVKVICSCQIHKSTNRKFISQSKLSIVDSHGVGSWNFILIPIYGSPTKLTV